jgi:TusA-related sulfurtransferase
MVMSPGTLKPETPAQDMAVAQRFLLALAARDFKTLAGLFDPGVRFRALTPSATREATGADGATGWLRRWFGAADSFTVLSSSVTPFADRYHISFRLSIHEQDGWRLVEQQAYLLIEDGAIRDMALLCSGFRPDPSRELVDIESNSGGGTTHSRFAAAAFYDAGNKGCAEGPLEEIGQQMRRLASGQQLEVRATAPSVAADLPAWCRLAGYELVRQEGDHYLLRKR